MIIFLPSFKIFFLTLSYKYEDDLKNEDEIQNITWKNCWWLLTLTGTTKLTQNQKKLSKPEIEFDMMKEMYAALGIGHAHMFRKDKFLAA